MKNTKDEIALAFSKGNFTTAYPYLSDEIVWEIIGEKRFNGKSEVISNCERTARYFASVETIFKVDQMISSKDKVIITGMAEFRKNNELLDLISACDLYTFNSKQKIKKITSYCISIKPKIV